MPLTNGVIFPESMADILANPVDICFGSMLAESTAPAACLVIEGNAVTSIHQVGADLLAETHPPIPRVLIARLVMEARVPDLPKGPDILQFGEVATQIDPASEQHVQNPAIAAPRLLRLSTGVARPTSPRRLILACESKDTSKNKEECNTIANV
jgi:hypothetical protein